MSRRDSARTSSAATPRRHHLLTYLPTSSFLSEGKCIYNYLPDIIDVCYSIHLFFSALRWTGFRCTQLQFAVTCTMPSCYIYSAVFWFCLLVTDRHTCLPIYLPFYADIHNFIGSISIDLTDQATNTRPDPSHHQFTSRPSVRITPTAVIDKSPHPRAPRFFLKITDRIVSYRVVL